METKAAPFVWPSWRRGKPQWQIIDYESYVNEGFNLNTLIYEAIMYKVRAISSAPLRAYKGDADNPDPLPPEHELAKLIDRPNPHQSQYEFQSQNTTYLNISGNCYIYLDRPEREGVPQAMYSFRPDRMFIKPHPTKKGEIAGYLYKPEGSTQSEWIPLLPRDVMHIKLPNPGDPLEGMGYGLSPISALARSANVDNDITHFLKLFFEKGTMLMGVLKFPEGPMLDEAEIKKIKERWKEAYGGYEKWEEIGVLGQGGEYQRISPTFEEMGFKTIDERNEARVLGPFGVPLELLPTRLGQRHSTFANKEEARRMCWEDTLIPEIRLFEVEYQYHLQGEGGEFVAHDLSKVPALRRDVKELIEGAYKMWQMGTPADIAYQTVCLKVEDFEGSDTPHLPINIMPAGAEKPALPSGPGASVEDEEALKVLPAPSESTPGFSEETKQRFSIGQNRIADMWLEPFKREVRRLFERDKRALLARLSKVGRKAIDEKATLDWQELRNAWLDYIDQSKKEWAEGMRPQFEGLVRNQVTYLDTMLANTKQMPLEIEWELIPKESLEWLNTYTMHFGEKVASVTGKTMEHLLEQAMEEGWSTRKLRANLGQVFEQWMDGDLTPDQFAWFAERMPQYRLDMIARTETIRASNKGAEARYEAYGIEYKEWWCARDEQTCDFCLEMHGKVWRVGEVIFAEGSQMNVQVEDKMQTLKFGYEDVTCPPLHPCCRCTLLPVVEGQAGRDYDIPGQVSQAALECQSYGLETGREQAILLDSKGNQIVSVMGEKNFVDLNVAYKTHPGRIHTIIHNHPSNTSFSAKDICGIFTQSETQHIVAVAHDGTVYVASILPDTPALFAQMAGEEIRAKIGTDWVRIHLKLRPHFKQLVEAGRMSASAAWREHSHRTILELAREYSFRYVRITPEVL